MGVTVSGKIYTTTDYARFKTVIGNREDAEARAKKYIKSIQERGQMQPIIVNKDFEVIDGQARLVCLRELDMPVNFIVQDATLGDIIDINTNTAKWKTRDIIAGYAANGNLTCKYVDNLQKQFPDIPLTTVLDAMTGLSANRRVVVEQLPKKKTTQKDYEIAQENLEFVRQVKPFVISNAGGTQPVFRVILWLCKQENFIKARLLDGLKKWHSILRPMPTVEIAVAELERIYNYRKHEKVFFVDAFKGKGR